MSAHERLEREMAIAEGRAWLETRPAAFMAADRVAGAFYYPGAHMDGAGYGDILMAIREPDNPHDENAIALCSALALVGHVPACAAAMLAPVMDAGHALWARIVREVTADQPSTVLVEIFGPAVEAGKADSEEIGWDDDTDDIPF